MFLFDQAHTFLKSASRCLQVRLLGLMILWKTLVTFIMTLGCPLDQGQMHSVL